MRAEQLGPPRGQDSALLADTSGDNGAESCLQHTGARGPQQDSSKEINSIFVGIRKIRKSVCIFKVVVAQWLSRV